MWPSIVKKTRQSSGLLPIATMSPGVDEEIGGRGLHRADDGGVGLGGVIGCRHTRGSGKGRASVARGRGSGPARSGCRPRRRRTRTSSPGLRPSTRIAWKDRSGRRSPERRRAWPLPGRYTSMRAGAGSVDLHLDRHAGGAERLQVRALRRALRRGERRRAREAREPPARGREHRERCFHDHRREPSRALPRRYAEGYHRRQFSLALARRGAACPRGEDVPAGASRQRRQKTLRVRADPWHHSMRARSGPEQVRRDGGAGRSAAASREVGDPTGRGVAEAVRQVHAPPPDRDRRDGRDLPRPATIGGRVREAPRHQADPPVHERQQSVHRHAAARGAHRCHALAPQHRADVRRRAGRRHLLRSPWSTSTGRTSRASSRG